MQDGLIKLQAEEEVNSVVVTAGGRVGRGGWCRNAGAAAAVSLWFGEVGNTVVHRPTLRAGRGRSLKETFGGGGGGGGMQGPETAAALPPALSNWNSVVRAP